MEEYDVVLGLVPTLDLWRRERGREREASRKLRVGLVGEDGGLRVLFIK